MSRITTAGLRSLLFVSLVTATASAQPIGGLDHAPVPRQVLNARTVFIGNAGGESYGAESYYSRNKYDGGPNRAYEGFYAAMKDWGHFDIVGSTDAADVALVIKFSSPVVDNQLVGSGPGRSINTVADPQLNLSINDPHTGIALWTLTEHIEPGGNRDEDNRHFDEAIGRLVNDLRRLILMPDLALMQNSGPPPGAARVAERRQREINLGIGALLGGAIGGVLASRGPNYNCAPFPTTLTLADLNAPPPDLSCESREQSQKMKNGIFGVIGGTIIGGLVGWFFPVSF